MENFLSQTTLFVIKQKTFLSKTTLFVINQKTKGFQTHVL